MQMLTCCSSRWIRKVNTILGIDKIYKYNWYVLIFRSFREFSINCVLACLSILTVLHLSSTILRLTWKNSLLDLHVNVMNKTT